MPATPPIIDLRSDTVTKPSSGMREAMAAAEVGDDVYGEDPTVNELQAYAAALFGKEAALFVPTGTMANLLAFLSQTRPGDTAILGADAHPFHYEAANLAVVGGLLTRLAPVIHGKYTPEALEAQILRSHDHHFSNTTIAAIENTTNRGGGTFYAPDEVNAMAAAAHAHGLRFHCDGARIFNAVVTSGAAPADFARACDTLCFCMSKGLGAPVGSLLLGSAETIHEAHRFRKMLGGGMRQAGVLAAAGLYALRHQAQDLAADHERARGFRQAVEQMGYECPLPSPTNIVYIADEDAAELSRTLAERGVLANAVGETLLRVVFHRDVDDDGLKAAVEAFRMAARR